MKYIKIILVTIVLMLVAKYGVGGAMLLVSANNNPESIRVIGMTAFVLQLGAILFGVLKIILAAQNK